MKKIVGQSLTTFENYRRKRRNNSALSFTEKKKMANAEIKDPGRYVISGRMRTVFSVLMFIGAVGLAVGLMRDPQRAWMAYLVAFYYFVTLSIGGLFFSALQHATKAGWSVNIRRLSESFTSFLPLAAVGAVILWIGAPKLYTWLDASAVASDELLTHKHGYLNGTFFTIRLVLFFGGWLLFKKMLVGDSIAQDKNGDENLTVRMLRWSIAFLLFFAFSYSLLAVDLLMSVDAHWFSTIFGIYTFAGLFQSTMAFMILTLIYLRRKNLMTGFATDDHMHDLGKFMFAFTVFWAYIAFSQYMLIWYANLPEETTFIIPRTEGQWLPVSLLLLIGRFFVPFLALLPRWAKRTPAHLGAVAIWILAMEYLDLYWLVYPAFSPTEVKFGLYEICIYAGFLGAFLFAVTRFLSRNNLVPIKDPRIQESLHHHVTY
jgi:hypothetical protein